MVALRGMRISSCPECGKTMKKSGSTSSGRTRWRCKDPGCGSSLSRGYGRRAMDLEASLAWLFSKESQAERGVAARTLRRRNELMWGL